MKFPSAAGAEGGARPGRVGPSLQPVPLVPLGKSCGAGLILLTYFFFFARGSGEAQVGKRGGEILPALGSSFPKPQHNSVANNFFAAEEGAGISLWRGSSSSRIAKSVPVIETF